MAADPRLPAAVSNAGGLGTMGLWWLDDPGQLVDATAALCDRPFGGNFALTSDQRRRDDQAFPPAPAALFYATDDDRAGDEVERFIRTAGFEAVKAGGIEQSDRLEVCGDLRDRVVGAAEARSLISRA